MTDLCLKNEAYTVCSALVPWRADDGFLLQERGIQIRVAYVGSLLIETGIHSV